MRRETFRLKQFSLIQGRSAMKVGTDALLLGSWLATLDLDPLRAMDIGAGSGIISLMLTQSYPKCHITAIEIDSGAAQDARHNAFSSPFASRIEVVEGDFLHHHSHTKYDLIVSNPPYCLEHHPSPLDKRRQARSELSTGLNLQSLLTRAQEYLTPNGSICLVTPIDREQDLRAYAASLCLRLSEAMVVYSVHHTPLRLLSRWIPIHLSAPYQCTRYRELELYAEHKHGPSAAYQELTSPFLL